MLDQPTSLPVLPRDHAEVGSDQVDWAPPALQSYGSLLSTTSSFMKTIQEVLHPEDEDFTPPMM